MIAYDYIRGTPVGDLLVAAGENGVCAVMLGRSSIETKRRELARRFPGARLEHDPARLGTYVRKIEEYLAGRRKRLDIPFDISPVRSPFARRVLMACSRVPFGRTTSYGDLARRAGHPRSARAVGTVMAKNPLPILIPCHRVIGSSGDLRGYSGGLHYKKRLLRLEGVEVSGRKVAR